MVRTAAAMARTDAAGARVREALDRAGIDHLVIKGRAFARRLYQQPVQRPYSDTDILIPLVERRRAAHVLASLEYRRLDRDGGSLEAAGYSHTFWHRDGGLIDLHWNLPGIGAPPELTWTLLRARTERMSIGGRAAAVPDGDATALIVALHNAHHGARWPSSTRDLERAAVVLPERAWRRAQTLARLLQAEEAFAAGLALNAAGRRIAERLELPSSLPLEYRVRAAGSSHRAWALHRLAAARATRARVRVIIAVLAPPPQLMRDFFPLARRGGWGLTLAYLLRPLRLVLRFGPALIEYLRLRGRSLTQTAEALRREPRDHPAHHPGPGGPRSTRARR